MITKDYCSNVCGAKCCRAHSGMVFPLACPNLTAENLCRIYPKRLGFKIDAIMANGDEVTCRCTTVENFLPKLPKEIREQCCYHNPRLLEERAK